MSTVSPVSGVQFAVNVAVVVPVMSMVTPSLLSDDPPAPGPAPVAISSRTFPVSVVPLSFARTRTS